LQWVIDHDGITSEANYPFSSRYGQTGTCNTREEKPVAATIS